MRVFDNGPWDVKGGADHLISQFDYLNCSDRVEAERVREFVEDLFSRYPESEEERLRWRLRAKDNSTHLSAFFELFLHDLLLRCGCTVLAIEPNLETSERSPDFLAETEDGCLFYLEATLATGRSQTDEGADRRLREALQAIDDVPSPDYFFDLHIRGKPDKPISGKRLKIQLESWLATLDFEEISSCWEHKGRPSSSFCFEEHGVRFRLYPIPRGASRGKTERGRAIATRSLAPLTVQPQEPIRKSIIKKAGRYGELSAPYVIAVNAMGEYARYDSAVDAVFGSPATSVQLTDQGSEVHDCRAKDGVWLGQKDPKNTRVSAILSTERLTPWSVGQRRMRLIINPWATHPLGPTFFPCDIVDFEKDNSGVVEKAPLREIFELPEGWPE